MAEAANIGTGTADSAAALPQQHTRTKSEDEAAKGIVPSHGISINYPPTVQDGRLHPVRHMSTPAYQSPIRHHRRQPSKSHGVGVKETLNARSHYGSSDDDSTSAHRINQYIIKQEIGRGSFGAVHLAVDQFGNEYAVKEFSKSRLRKRAQSNLLRQPNQQRRRPGQLAAGLGFNSPLHRLSSSDKLTKQEENNSLSLIKEEIAIMKKLNHHNLVSLIEVLDDPDEDSLYMVLEMCKKGVVMKVGLEERAEPYEEEACRCWFRDMILGIEYLHAQGIIHRDIKPDNCLITDDDVLKIVDFGVSEMFEKESDMATAKSAGSPAFMPPELCVAKHGQVSGRAADIWSMGVTLYCLRYGHIPFEKTGMLELYDSIRYDDVPLDEENDRKFEDLMRRLLGKDPEKRITMDELREHPWVTKNGTDPLLPKEENCSDLVEPPTEQEKNHAITGNMGHLLAVMRAVKSFKKLLQRRRPQVMDGFFGRDSRIVSPPTPLRTVHDNRQDARGAKSVDAHDRRPLETALNVEGVHHDVNVDDELNTLPIGVHRRAVMSPPDHSSDDTTKSNAKPNAEHNQENENDAHDGRPQSNPAEHRQPQMKRAFTFANDHAKGHAHDPLEDRTFLEIGPGEPVHFDPEQPIVSESPPAVELNIYETAYQDEMKRILERKNSADLYLNRRMDHREDIREHENILDTSRDAANAAKRMGGNLMSKLGVGGGQESGKGSGLAALVKMAKKQDEEGNEEQQPQQEETETHEHAKKQGGEGKEEQQPQQESSAGDGDHGKISMLKNRVDSTLGAKAAELDPRNEHSSIMPGGFPLSPEPKQED